MTSFLIHFVSALEICSHICIICRTYLYILDINSGLHAEGLLLARERELSLRLQIEVILLHLSRLRTRNNPLWCEKLLLNALVRLAVAFFLAAVVTKLEACILGLPFG